MDMTKLQSATIPTIVPKDFYFWCSKIKGGTVPAANIVEFSERKRAPNLRLKKENYVFKVVPKTRYIIKAQIFKRLSYLWN